MENSLKNAAYVTRSRTNGFLFATFKGLPGVVAQGKNMEELQERINDARELALRIQMDKSKNRVQVNFF